MSWSLEYPEIKNLPAADALKLVGASNAPQSIKDYAATGIASLHVLYGDDVRVTVTGHGHLCDGPGSYEVTTSTIEVRRAEVKVAPIGD